MATTYDVSEHIGEPTSPRSRASPGFTPLKSTPSGSVLSEHLERLYLYFTLYGSAFLVVGVIALILCIVVFRRISVPEMIAWILVVGGLLAFLQAILLSGYPSSSTFWALGILHLVVGLWLLIQANVRSGSQFVWLLTLWFLIHGFLKLIMSSQVRIVTSWPALLTTGVVSVVLGFVNLGLARAYGKRLTGIFFGVDLAVSAICFLVVAYGGYMVLRISETTGIIRDPLLRQPGFSAAASA